MNGTTVHGTQSTDPAKRGRRRAYYVRNGPVGDLFAICRRRDGGRPQRSASSGSVVARSPRTSTPDMTMTFYEIDPVVVQVA